ncbi:unnamed protein product [Oikopleura dioica]|uniref:Uncharacterized protein n=1 Tax=Oikopleura dioica TaxID=34765 RepID=E4YTI9_OIKDI|nr:unnamed protein product [Oikopleura dioica]
MALKLKIYQDASVELDELVQENTALELDLANITGEKEFIQGESEKLKEGINEIQGNVTKNTEEARALASHKEAKERTFSLAQDRQNKEFREVENENKRLQEQLDKLDYELSLINSDLKNVEDDSEVMKNLNEEFTTPSKNGIFDKNQEKLTARIHELTATVSCLKSEAKTAKPKVSKAEIEKAQRELGKTSQRLELEQSSRQSSLQEKQELLAQRERERPRLEKIMKDNAKWELRQSEMLFDELKKEKKEYLIKLQELNRQVKERNRRDINFKDTASEITMRSTDNSIAAFN